MKKILSLLGLCTRAGKTISGEKAVVAAVRAGQACCVLLDSAAAANAVKSVTDSCTYHGVKLIVLPQGALGAAIGKPGRMAVAITDRGFAQTIIQYYEQAHA